MTWKVEPFYLKSWVILKVVILTWKVEPLAELKFDPGFRVIGEYLNQIDSILRVNFEIDPQLVPPLFFSVVEFLVPPVTQPFRSRRLFFQCYWSRSERLCSSLASGFSCCQAMFFAALGSRVVVNWHMTQQIPND